MSELPTSLAGERIAPVQQRHLDYLAMRIPNQWVSFGLMLAFAVSGLIAETEGKPIAVAGFLGLTMAPLFLFPHFTLKAHARNAALLWPYPLWALLSTGWSIDPDRTWHSAWLLLPTMVAVGAIGAMPRRLEVATAAFATLFGYVLYSLVAGHMNLGDPGNFAGVITGKNMFGHVAAMEIIMSTVMVGWLGTRFGQVLTAWGIAGVLVGALALVASHAAGSTIATLLALTTFVVILSFRRLAMLFRITILAGLAGAGILYLAFGHAIEDSLFSYVLQRFGKDTTLTGRTELWDVANRLIAERPMIGRGYNAFWYYTNPDAWMLWREMGVLPMHGFNFHNTFREILVEGGAVGLALFFVPVAYFFVRGFVAALISGDAVSASRNAMLVYFLVRMPVETVGYGAVTMDIFLFLGFLCIPVRDPQATPGVKRTVPAPRERFVDPDRVVADRRSRPERRPSFQ